MSAGKAAARDLRYGRRGGRWGDASAGDVEKTLDDLHRIRLDSLKRDDWPAASVDLWRAIAQDPTHPAHGRALDVVAITGRAS